MSLIKVTSLWLVFPFIITSVFRYSILLRFHRSAISVHPILTVHRNSSIMSIKFCYARILNALDLGREMNTSVG